jgi:hypothetical protein
LMWKLFFSLSISKKFHSHPNSTFDASHPMSLTHVQGSLNCIYLMFLSFVTLETLFEEKFAQQKYKKRT